MTRADVTRIAPTPSGYLHLGNAANVLATAWWAQTAGLQVALRIDDHDAGRLRPEYVDDIFDLLTWLGIDWMAGPRTTAQLESTRATRIKAARTALDTALSAGLPAYACRCSRRDLSGVPTGGCAGGCRARGLDLTPHTTTLRLAVEPGTTVRVEGEDVDLASALGDFVLWRRDDLPAYQWASTIEDAHLGVTHILRGTDLIASTAAQTHLAHLLNLPYARSVRHHPLVLGADGEKLSKSQTVNGTPLTRDEATRATVTALAADLAAACGIRRP